MKTTKNKIAKGIKIVSSIPLYYALFLSAGCDWFVAKKKQITPIAYTESEQNPICYQTIDNTTQDESISINDKGIDNPTFMHVPTDNNNNLLDLPNAEAVSTAPQQQPARSQAALAQNRNTTNPTLVPEQNNSPSKSTASNPLNQNTEGKSGSLASDGPKKNSNEDRVNNNELQSNQGSKQAKPKPSSVPPLKDRPKQSIPRDQSPLSPQQDLQAKIDKLKRLCTEVSQNKNNKKLINNIKIKDIKEFCERNSKNAPTDQDGIKLALTVANTYIASLEKIIK